MMNRLGRRSALPHDPSSHVGSSWNGNVNRRAFAELVLRNVRQLWQSDWVTGSWMSLANQPGIMLDSVRRAGDSVEFELENLKFDGKVQGRAIAGTVANSDGSSSGNFTLARVDPPMSPVSGP